MFVLRKYHASKVLPTLHTITFRKMFSEIRNKSVVNSDVNAEDGGDSTEDSVRFSEEEILQKRNKSRLTFSHRNQLHNKHPYPEACFDHHNSVRYKRRMYGLFGDNSGVEPSICWPTPSDILYSKEYESVSRPHSIQEMMKINAESKEAERERVQKREEDIANKFANLARWQQELNARIKKRETDAAAAKEKKDRLIEEVRRHFGFKVDPRDDRFKEMLDKKEKEEKKLAKDAKKKAKEAKMLAQLAEKSEKSDSQNPI